MNFALILFVATLACGVVYLLEIAVFRNRRIHLSASELAVFDQTHREALASPNGAAARERGEREEHMLRPPMWIEYPVSFFPVLLIVFLLRSFVAEPFKIPSSSMRPTLEVGDFILVNKWSYGIRLPIIEKKILGIADPQRGDVVVFRYPVNPTQDFIKRVVGTPGDLVVYRDKALTVNGKAWPMVRDGSYSYLEGMRFETTERYLETVDTGSGTKEHAVAENPQAQPIYPLSVRMFPDRGNCDYNERGFSCRVPAGEYLMMGDNRDNSDDSRYWGFVPDDHLRGRAFAIWFNWDDISSFAFKRIGSGIR